MINCEITPDDKQTSALGDLLTADEEACGASSLSQRARARLTAAVSNHLDCSQSRRPF